MATDGWKLRAKLFVQRFWQPAGACMTIMPGSVANVSSLLHWGLALQTGLATGLLVLLLSFTPAKRLFQNRFSNAGMVALLTTLADAYSHTSRYGGFPYAEAILTGVAAGLLALAAPYLFEDRARRIRALWARRFGRAR